MRLLPRSRRGTWLLAGAVWCAACVGWWVFFTGGCTTNIGAIGDGPVPAENEVVMAPGMSISATTSVGTMTITAGNGLKRSYTWDGATRSVEMWPRGERWYGSLGLYFPGPGEHWQNHGGITRGVVQEGQQHFQNEEAASNWIAEQKWQPYVWRNDGLMVGWSKTLPRKQLSVDVWQIYIQGKKPTQLPGSQDEKIIVKQN